MGNGIAGGLGGLPKYFISSPPSQHLFFAMIVAALLFPIAGNDLFSKTGYAVFLIVPALLSSSLTWRAVKELGGYFKVDHSYLISTISLFGIAAILAIVSLIERFYVFEKWNALEILFVALAMVFILQLLVFFAVGGLQLHRAAVPAALQVLFSVLILLSFRVVEIKTLARFVALLLIAYALVWAFIKLTDAPFKRTLGISTSKLVSLAIREYADPASISINPFEATGKETKSIFQALRFDFGKGKALLAVPWLHPGPIESIGGKLPSLISDSLKGRFESSVFLHTYVDHSLNPIFPDKIAKKIRDLVLEQRNYAKASAKATRFIETRKGGVNVLGQKIGEVYFFITSFAPDLTDDISPAIGFNLLDRFGKKAIFIDAHNSMQEDADIDPVSVGDAKAELLMEAIELAKNRLGRENQAGFRVAIAKSEMAFIEEGVREISVIVFEVASQKTALVVLNANNLAVVFRDVVRKKLRAAGFDIAEVVTTDAHLGDFVIQKYGQTGLINPNILEREIMALAKKAASELRPASAAYLHAAFGAKVFGEKLYHQIIATGSSLIPFAKFVATTLFIAFLFSAYVLLQF